MIVTLVLIWRIRLLLLVVLQVHLQTVKTAQPHLPPHPPLRRPLVLQVSRLFVYYIDDHNI